MAWAELTRLLGKRRERTALPQRTASTRRRMPELVTSGAYIQPDGLSSDAMRVSFDGPFEEESPQARREALLTMIQARRR